MNNINEYFLIKQVAKSITNAVNDVSKCDENIIALEGLTTYKIRHFLNNLCDFEGCRYLEVGSFMGSSLCSAGYKNKLDAIIGIENFSEEFGATTPSRAKTKLYENIGKLAPDAKMHEENFFSMDLTKFSDINVYLYDGEHSQQSQYLQVLKAKPFLAKHSIMLVDDWFCEISRPDITTFKGINDAGFRIRAFNEMPRGDFHCGFGVFVLEKL